MTETTWTLPTPDGKTIYGVTNSSGAGATAAIFMVHGFTGNMYQYPFKRAADFLSAKGYDVYRFNLYDGRKGGRNLIDCTLLTHAEDLNTIMAKFGPGYTQNFVIGHSYGGPTIMLANPQNITAASLWDPSYNITQMNKDLPDSITKIGGHLILNVGISYVLSSSMEEHAGTLDEPACIKLAEAFNAPVQVVLAGDGYYVKQSHSYHSHGKPENLAKNRQDVVPGTTHCFHEADTCEVLLAKTHAFFQQFL